MADNVKNSKATVKPRKAPAKKASVLTMESRTNGSHTSSAHGPVSHEEVARVAHGYWAERGGQHGHDVEDWFRAEQELRARAS